LQSAEDYPHLLAKKRHLQLRDMSCGGATTKHILYGGQFLQGPQVDALDATTKLVTVTIGGNDVAYMASLFAASCRTGADKMPLWMRGGVCNLPLANNVDQKLQELAESMRKVADVVHQRSPHAQLIFIDYATSLPSTGNCLARLPITDEDLERGRHLAERLRQVTAEAAQQSGALLIQASEITRGHDVCSSDPWVFDWRFTPSHNGWGPMAYHPNEKAMRAIADAIDARLNEIEAQ
jgi:lysophospholipase L1-like esterase